MPTPSSPSAAEPGAPSDATGAALPVAAVARRLGVAPATLRTWARRYDLGPSEHAAGSHRRYTPADLARLEAMRRLTLEGVAPGEAARLARQQISGDGGPPVPLPTTGPAKRGGPGGRVLALPGAESVVRGLARAAMALDSRTVMTAIRSQLAEHGVVTTWDHVLRPVLAAAGARWASTGEGVEVEHLLSDCVTAALREVTEQLPTDRPGRPVLLAGAPDEQHSLPLHAVAAALAESGLAGRVLGPAMPATALQAAIRRTGAAALFLWSQLPRTGDPATLVALPVTRPPTALVLGGPGWDLDRLPGRAVVAHDLDEAVALLHTAVGL